VRDRAVPIDGNGPETRASTTVGKQDSHKRYHAPSAYVAHCDRYSIWHAAMHPRRTKPLERVSTGVIRLASQPSRLGNGGDAVVHL